MIIRSGGRMQVAGEVTMMTANALFKEGFKTPENGSMVVDFSRLEKVDSSAVSLMLFWLREAKRGKVSLHFENVPDNLLSLAKLYGVAGLLPLQTAE